MITSSPKDANANIILGLAGAIDDNKQETERPAPTEYIKTVDKGIGSSDFKKNKEDPDSNNDAIDSNLDRKMLLSMLESIIQGNFCKKEEKNLLRKLVDQQSVLLKQ